MQSPAGSACAPTENSAITSVVADVLEDIIDYALQDEAGRTFISKARAKHGSTYSYKNVRYVRARQNVDIICKVPGHGVFSQKPNNHLSGNGCPKCMADKVRTSFDGWVKKFREVHGSRYNYMKPLRYENGNAYVRVICEGRECGKTVWEVRCDSHAEGHGCPECGHLKSNANLDARHVPKTPEEFEEKCAEVWGDLYDYSLAVYDGCDTSVEIVCKVPGHGVFRKTPYCHLNRHEGCQRCSKKHRYTPEEFIALAQPLHIGTCSYPNTVYVNNHTPVKIFCEKCKQEFEQLPTVHIRVNKAGVGQGCRRCGGTAPLDTPTFIAKALAVHPPEEGLNYSKVEYADCFSYVTITCAKHGDFHQSPSKHLSGQGCPRCKNKRVSDVQMGWLQHMQSTKYPHLQFGMQNEFQIPNTRYFADGYDAESDTVLEFYGDFWHGNPEKYDLCERHPLITTQTYGDLYEETMRREAVIRGLGHNMLTIWESEWRDMCATLPEATALPSAPPAAKKRKVAQTTLDLHVRVTTTATTEDDDEKEGADAETESEDDFE